MWIDGRGERVDVRSDVLGRERSGFGTGAELGEMMPGCVR